MINFLKKDNRLILCYTPEYAGSVNWHDCPIYATFTKLLDINLF